VVAEQLRQTCTPEGSGRTEAEGGTVTAAATNAMTITTSMKTWRVMNKSAKITWTRKRMSKKGRGALI
jgi:hypothetical protein